MPNILQIENWLGYKRKKKFSSNLQSLDDFCSRSPNIIFPLKKKHYPTNFFEADGMTVVIIKFGDVLFEKFLLLLSQGKICGMDAQYSNNVLRRPIYVICCQDDSFRTIPGFVCFLAANNANHVEIMLEKIQHYLISYCNSKLSSKIMIDKCVTERKAIRKIGSEAILCDFHIQKLFSSRIKFIRNTLCQCSDNQLSVHDHRDHRNFYSW